MAITKLTTTTITIATTGTILIVQAIGPVQEIDLHKCPRAENGDIMHHIAVTRPMEIEEPPIDSVDAVPDSSRDAGLLEGDRAHCPRVELEVPVAAPGLQHDHLAALVPKLEIAQRVNPAPAPAREVQVRVRDRLPDQVVAEQIKLAIAAFHLVVVVMLLAAAAQTTLGPAARAAAAVWAAAE